MHRPLRACGVAAAVVAVLTTVMSCGSAAVAPAALPPPPGPTKPALYNRLPQAVKDAGVIRFAGDSHPPYRVVGPDGSITGIDRDFQDALARVLGVKVETEIVDGLPTALDGMLKGKFDAFNGPVKATPEREKQFDSITWMTTHTSYVVPAGSAIAKPEDLCGKKVAVVAASVVADQLTRLSAFCGRSGLPAAAAIPLVDTGTAVDAARAGRADAAGMTQAAAIDLTSQQPGLSYVTQTKEQGASTDFLALLVAKDTGLGPVLLDAFHQLFDDGTYADIITRYKLEDVAVAVPVYDINSVSADGNGPAGPPPSATPKPSSGTG
jgi:polar amino acid transport system substrate-binding protein